MLFAAEKSQQAAAGSVEAKQKLIILEKRIINAYLCCKVRKSVQNANFFISKIALIARSILRQQKAAQGAKSRARIENNRKTENQRARVF